MRGFGLMLLTPVIGWKRTLLAEELVHMQTRAGMEQEEAEQSARERSGGTLY